MKNKWILKIVISFCILFSSMITNINATTYDCENNEISNWTVMTSGGELFGNYYLTSNKTITTQIVVPANKTLNLWLNGHVLTISDNIKVSEGATLNLYDCNKNKNYIVKEPYYGNEVKIDTGYITGSGGSAILNNGTFNMYGGAIAKNSNTFGGGITNYGYFNMYGGSIVANNASNLGGYGGGIINYSDSVTKIYGGEISHNYALSSGGGICSWIGAKTYIYGGNINNNISTYGGGIYTNGNAPLTIEGGTIKNNKAGRGAGIYAGSTVNYSGNPSVYDNSLTDGTIENFHSNNPITIIGEITGGKFDFYKTNGESTIGWKTYMADKLDSYSNYFSSGVSGYSLTLSENNELILAKNIFIKFNSNNGTGNSEQTGQALLSGVKTELNENTFSKKGYSFCGWNTLKNGKGTSYKNGEKIKFTEDVTLYAQWCSNQTLDKSKDALVKANNPKTEDNLIVFLTMLMISIFGISLLVVFRKKLLKKKDI